MPTAIDQRLASRFHLWQVDVLRRSEHLSRKTAGPWNRLLRELFVLAAGEPLPDFPWEPNCRCYASPVLQPPEEFLGDPAVRATFKNASADLVPDPSAYSRWFERAEQSARKTAVGVRRYQAMQRQLQHLGRRPEWIDFITPEGKLLSPGEIRTEDAFQREARRREVEAVLAQRELLFSQVAG